MDCWHERPERLHPGALVWEGLRVLWQFPADVASDLPAATDQTSMWRAPLRAVPDGSRAAGGLPEIESPRHAT